MARSLFVIANAIFAACQTLDPWNLQYPAGTQEMLAGNASGFPSQEESPSLLPRSCPSGDGLCPDGYCYPVGCCPDGSGCATGEKCCSVCGTSGCCVPSTAQCCSDGTYCNAGNHCYKYIDEGTVCCTDQSCTAYVNDQGTTTTRTLTYSAAYTFYWYSYYYYVELLTYTEYSFISTFYVTAVGTSSLLAVLSSETSSVRASLTNPANTTPTTSPTSRVASTTRAPTPTSTAALVSITPAPASTGQVVSEPSYSAGDSSTDDTSIDSEFYTTYSTPTSRTHTTTSSSSSSSTSRQNTVTVTAGLSGDSSRPEIGMKLVLLMLGIWLSLGAFA